MTIDLVTAENRADFSGEEVHCCFCNTADLPMAVIPNYDEYQRFVCRACALELIRLLDP